MGLDRGREDNRRFTPRNPDFEAVVRDSFARQGAMAYLGAELVTVEPGYVEIELPYRNEVSQQRGYFHGGFTATIADSAGGYAAYSLMPAGADVLTVEFKVSLIAPARGERLVARGRVKRSGRTLSVTEIDVFAIQDGAETLCAAMLQTLICLPPDDHRDS